MKRLITFFSLIIISLTGIFAMNSIANERTEGQDRKSLDKLWKEYESSRRSDRPERQMEILSEIKVMAKNDRLPWDFYKASMHYSNIGASRNWKLLDSLENEKKRSFEEFGSAVLSFYTKKNDPKGMPTFLSANRQELEHGHNEGFYTDDSSFRSRVWSGVITDGLRNDYEYALWSIFFNGDRSYFKSSDDYDACVKMLDDVLAGRYPESAIKEYDLIYRKVDDSRYDELKAYAERYKGKAVSLLAQQDILMHEFDVLNEKEAGSEEFKALRGRCEAFEKERGQYSGAEKKIAETCKRVEMLIKSLDGKSISASVQDNVVTVLLRNLGKVNLSLEKDRKKTFSKSIENSVGSYYTYDTLTLELPVMDDGDYTLLCENGSYSYRSTYSRYTISIANRTDSKGVAVFAADAVSGKPLTSADLILFDRKDEVKAESDAFVLDGFTYLPESITAKIDKESHVVQRIQVRYKDSAGVTHLSRKAALSTNYWERESANAEQYYGKIILDRAAFNPEETVQFKALVYYGDLHDGVKVIGAGEKVSARLYDAEYNILKSEDFITNEFGSVSGSFFLPRQRRNGLYRIELAYKGEILDQIPLRVDDFVLPTFTMNLDQEDRLILPGEVIEIRGSILAYSGHSLSDANVSYILTKNGVSEKTQALKLEADGSFCINIASDEDSPYQSYYVQIKVVDNTGETQEWGLSRSVSQRIPYLLSIEDRAEGRMELIKQHEYNDDEDYSTEMVSKDEFKIVFDSWGKKRDDISVEYSLTYAGKTVENGTGSYGGSKTISLKGKPSGLYTLTSTARVTSISGKEYISKSRRDILLVREGDQDVDAGLENVFKVLDDDRTGVLVGSNAGPTWVAIDLFGKNNVRLGHRMVHLDKGKNLELVEFSPEDSWSDVVRLTAIYFRNNRSYTFSHDFDRSRKALQLPIKFTRFEDRTRPASPYVFELQTAPGVECAASIFDKSTETMMFNRWGSVTLNPYRPSVRNECIAGTNSSTESFYDFDGIFARSGDVKMMKNASVMAAAPPAPDAMMEDAVFEEEEAIPFMAADNETDGATGAIRENFANTIAFEPALKSDQDGRIEFSFRTADKLSTYMVQIFAHDKDMRNEVLRRDMIVTIPVKVAVAEPQFLYSGDKYSLRASVSSNMDTEVKGTIRAEFYDGEDYRTLKPVKVDEIPVSLSAKGSASCHFDYEVPEIEKLGVKLVFTADDASQASDAIFFSIPVLKPVQAITEAHSALLRDGEDKDALIAALRKEFVNVPGESAEVREISILQMIKEAIPDKVEPESQNVLDLSEALYIRRIASRLKGFSIDVEKSDEAIVNEIIACRNSDGGFGWFKDFDSSPVITATMLERIASMRSRRLAKDEDAALFSEETITSAVQYLDKCQFEKGSRPGWCGGISFEQYVSVRAEFCEVPFKTNGFDRNALKAFKKAVKSYLVPNKERGLNGMILSKARRIKVLMALSGSEDGIKLASDWGISLLTKRRLETSMKADCASLLEYAVEHKSGGWYSPNAVMPFRGLLETEAYAHVYISGTLDNAARRHAIDEAKASRITDGIRLWFMIQKESQDWEKDAAFAEALANVLSGSEALLNTKVIALSSAVELPFSEVKAAGNGMSISRKWYVEIINESGKKEWKELESGSMLKVGDKIRAEYNIWNEENRSYIKINAGRPANLKPVEQLSGHYGWWLEPLRISGWYSFRPSGYRSVLKDATEYWFDVYPEEKTTINEEFYVTQSGSFQMPAVSIESLYAPHYRANDKAGQDMGSE